MLNRALNPRLRRWHGACDDNGTGTSARTILGNTMSFKLRYALLAATLVTGAGAGAYAQQTAASEAQQLPTIKGKVAQYSLTPRGDVDGFILQDGTEVHMPPHLSAELVYTVRPGDTVTIRGLKAAAVPMVQAMSVTNDASGQTVTDNGPPGGGPGRRGPGGAGQQIQDQGRIKEQLHGPRGDLNGVLLEDGTMVRLPPPEARRLASELAPGQQVFASGNGVAGPLGKVIAARSIGPTQAQATEVAAPPHRHGPPPPGGRRGPPPIGQDGTPTPDGAAPAPHS